MIKAKKNKLGFIRPMYWISLSVCTVSLIIIFLTRGAVSEELLLVRSGWLTMLYPFGGFVALVQLLAGFEPVKEHPDWSLVYPELKKDN